MMNNYGKNIDAIALRLPGVPEEYFISFKLPVLLLGTGTTISARTERIGQMRMSMIKLKS
jgi:hypothetical protein